MGDADIWWPYKSPGPASVEVISQTANDHFQYLDLPPAHAWSRAGCAPGQPVAPGLPEHIRVGVRRGKMKRRAGGFRSPVPILRTGMLEFF